MQSDTISEHFLMISILSLDMQVKNMISVVLQVSHIPDYYASNCFLTASNSRYIEQCIVSYPVHQYDVNNIHPTSILLIRSA